MREQQTIKHHKIDHPSRDPRRAKAERIGKKRMEKMQFQSEGEKRDYERAVLANPRNVMGYPRNLLFPPVKIRAMSFSVNEGWGCDECGAELSGPFEKCQSCGYQVEMCDGHPFYERHDDNGKRFCARCGRFKEILQLQEGITQ